MQKRPFALQKRQFGLQIRQSALQTRDLDCRNDSMHFKRDNLYCNNNLNGQSNNSQTFIYFFNFKYSADLLKNKSVSEKASL